jgi:predicted dehydrogenase
MADEERIRFGVVGTNHRHIRGQVECLTDAGAEFVSFYEAEPALADDFAARYPSPKRARSEAEVLEDRSIQLLVTAAIPADRAPLCIRAMRLGKDVMTDKPGMTTLAQLEQVRQVQRETGRIFSICFSERFETRSTVKAWELVQSGSIGRVVHTTGLGPHRINRPTRPDWFFAKERLGGILTDIASHQADQFLLFTGSTAAEVVAAHIANYANTDKPEFEDFGEVMWRGNGGTGYVRVDWYTPDGLPTWGDGRLTILGTEGYIELRKYVDIAGRPGIDHLFLVDGKGMRYVDCANVALPYGPALIHDVLYRTETAMPQAHCFLASELALKAEALATNLTASR